MNQTRQFGLKLAAAVALVALGGLAGFALNANHGDATTAASPPVQVRTQVIKHTVRIHRKAKPAKQPPRAATPPPAPPPVVAATAPRPVVAAPVAPVRAHAPIRTRTSGAPGHGGEGEHEHEHEGRDD